MNTYFNFAGFSFGLALLLLLVFGILQWLQIPAGSFLDWGIGGASFWWLMLIVTVPWNIHFEAKAVLAEAEESQKKEIQVDPQQIQYVTQLSQRSLGAAIALHLLSAIGLFFLAITGISAVGYIGSGAALLLTLLRPSVRLYHYLAMRLSLIRNEFLYPREDMVELRRRVIHLEEKIQHLEGQFNPEEPTSWVATQTRQLEGTRNDLTRLAASLETLKSTNQSEHHQLAREAQNAIAQLSTDGQVLDHVREIIRFFKEA